MKTKVVTALFLILTGTYFSNAQTNNSYTLVVEGYDWGPAASKVVLQMDNEVTEINPYLFNVEVIRSSSCMAADNPNSKGTRDVVYAYVSDAKGNHLEKGNHVTLNLAVGPQTLLDSPIQYFSTSGCNGNKWVDYQLTITNTKTQQVWNKESNRIIPLVDEFDLTGSFAHKSTVLKYASFRPKAAKGKLPLIIWLHGGGEGGTDPSIVLLANRAANYASPEIQGIFGGAHVLVPQSPTFWMQNEQGQYTRGEVNDIYNESLMTLFKSYLKEHPSVDPNRIYVGGCSNGGYMTQKLMLLNPDFFAAGFPSALAYFAEFLSKKDVETLAEQSIWYIHSKDDPVTRAPETVIPTYEKLMEAGAKDIHLSLYDHVIDLYGVYGGEDYHLNGHFSWVYSHRDHAKKVIDGKMVTVMEWLANKRK